jgi:hypothetical protein
VWETTSVARFFWSDSVNRKGFMDQLAMKLNVQQFSDWYNIKQSDVIKHGGKGLLKYYGGSLSKGK